MTDQGYRNYLLIADRSGSMVSIRDEAQNGIRHFVREQATLPGRATLTLCQFDNIHETVHDFAPLEAAAGYELIPRNSTALLDACGFAITAMGQKLAAMPEQDRPGKVIVLITTDGRENSSREYSLRQVRSLIIRQHKEFGWQFSYVGANVDAFEEAASLGIPGQATMDYAATRGGTRGAYAAASAASLRFSRGDSADISYTDEERKKAAGK